MCLRAHIHEKHTDIFLRIKAISTSAARVFGSFCELYLFPFTCKDEKDWPIT